MNPIDPNDNNFMLDIIEEKPKENNTNFLVHYAMSFLLQVPMYLFTGAKTFARYTRRDGSLVQVVEPFTLMPIRKRYLPIPPEYIRGANSEEPQTEAFNPELATQGLTKGLNFSALQNLNKLLSEYHPYWVREIQAIQTREDGQALCDIVFPVRNPVLFPPTMRTVRVSKRVSIFTDQVAKYFASAIPAERIERATFAGDKEQQEEQRTVCFSLLEELSGYADGAMEYAGSVINLIIAETEKNVAGGFVINKNGRDAVETLHFQALTATGQDAPNIRRTHSLSGGEANGSGDLMMQQLINIVGQLTEMQKRQLGILDDQTVPPNGQQPVNEPLQTDPADELIPEPEFQQPAPAEDTAAAAGSEVEEELFGESEKEETAAEEIQMIETPVEETAPVEEEETPEEKPTGGGGKKKPDKK